MRVGVGVVDGDGDCCGGGGEGVVSVVDCDSADDASVVVVDGVFVPPVFGWEFVCSSAAWTSELLDSSCSERFIGTWRGFFIKCASMDGGRPALHMASALLSRDWRSL